MKKIIIIPIITSIVLLCSCQKKETVIYELPPNNLLTEQEQQMRNYGDLLEKYCSLHDTAQIQLYIRLHQAALDSSSAILNQEVSAFMAEKKNAEKEYSKGITIPQMIVLCVLLIAAISMLIYISIICMFWTRLGWLFEYLWHWFKRTIGFSSHYDENLADDDIHEGNSSKASYKFIINPRKDGHKQSGEILRNNHSNINKRF